MAYKPKISVVMPIYNRAYCLQNAIMSVWDQEFWEWELIIIDDGSDDNPRRILERFETPKIKYKRLEHTGYIGAVRNAGNQMVDSDIIVVHDSDDMAFPNRLLRIYEAFQADKKLDLFYHSMLLHMFDKQRDALHRDWRRAIPYSKYKLLREQYIPGQVAYKTETILKYPYNEEIYCCDDYQMLLEFALNDRKFGWTEEILYEYMYLEDSINITGEATGKRKHDVEIIQKILKDKYDLESRFDLIKHDVESGKIITHETI